MMHKTLGQRDPALAFPLASTRDDAGERRQANRAVAASAIGLAVTGLAELLLAVLTGSVGLLGDAIHNLSDVSTSAVVFLGFRLSRRPPTEKYPYGLERAEDLAGVGIAVVIWASAAFAGYESIRKLIDHGHTAFVGAGIAGAVLGIVGNQIVARYKLVVGRRIGSATLIADARHSWLDALSSAGALAGLIAVALGWSWGDPVAGLAVTAFICHVGYEVTADVMHRLADGVDPDVITRAEAAAGSIPGVIHAHARARWTGRTLRVEVEGWVDPDTSARDADDLGRLAADEISRQLPEAGAFTWTTRAAPRRPLSRPARRGFRRKKVFGIMAGRYAGPGLMGAGVQQGWKCNKLAGEASGLVLAGRGLLGGYLSANEGGGAVAIIPGANGPGPGVRNAPRILAEARALAGPAHRAAIGALPAEVRRVAGYHAGWWGVDDRPADETGKAIRPALTLACAAAAGGQAAPAVDAAVAVELVHDFSLLHDDVMDGDPMRRGRPSAWTVFGVGPAILAGDALLAAAVRQLAESAVDYDGGALPLLRVLTGAMRELLNGQSADLAFANRTDVTLTECLAMAEGKTGALLGAACELGALAVSADSGTAACYREFGRQLGVAFQLIDDVLGIWGDPAVTGKPGGSDLASRKRSLPVVFTLTSGAAVGASLARLYEREGEVDEAMVAHMAELIVYAGGRAWAQTEAERRIQSASRALLAARPVPGAAAALMALATFTTRRDH